MSFTIYTFIMSLIWSNAFILLCAILIRKSGFLQKNGTMLIVSLMLASLLRLLVTVELPFTHEILSTKALPKFLSLIRTEVTFVFFHTDVATVLMALWIGICVIKILRIFIKQIDQKRTISKLHVVHDFRAASIAKKINAHSKFSRQYRLIVSDDLVTPMATGFFKPTILLPVLLVSDEDLDLIIQHEFTHVLHKDLWLRLLADVFCAVFWWNPLAYILREDLALIQEINIDMKITSGLNTNQRLEYLSSILQTAKQSKIKKIRVAAHAQLTGDSKESSLEQRFQTVIANPPKKSRLVTSCFLSAIAVVMLVSYSFVIQPHASPYDDIPGQILVSPENSFIIAGGDGTYTLVVDGVLFGNLQEEDLKVPPNSSLEIILETEENYED